jgi:hypothetical protein
METNTKILLFSLFLIILSLVILVFVLIKIRQDNAPKVPSEKKTNRVLPQFVNASNPVNLITNELNNNETRFFIPQAETKTKKRNVLEILATDLHSFLRNSIAVIFDNVYKRLFNTKLQGFIQYEDGLLKFSKDKNSYSKVMINSDGQIIIGRNLDSCLERKMIDSSGVSDIVVSTVSPITQSKKWKLKNGAILDPTENFCLGILDDKVKLFSVMFATERSLTDQIDKWMLIK